MFLSRVRACVCVSVCLCLCVLRVFRVCVRAVIGMAGGTPAKKARECQDGGTRKKMLEADKIVLIGLVEEREALWKQSAVGYHNKNTRQALWLEIQRKLPSFSGKYTCARAARTQCLDGLFRTGGFDCCVLIAVKDLQAKWKNCVDTLRRKRAQCAQATGRSGQEVPPPYDDPYRYEHLMGFIQDDDATETTRSNWGKRQSGPANTSSSFGTETADVSTSL